MTRDEVIALAREAGLFVPQAGIPENGALTRFAALVAAHEREACAKICEEISPKTEPVEYGDIRWGWKYRCPYAAAIRSRA